MKISLGAHGEIEQAMLSQLVKHVIEKSNSGGYVDNSGTVDVNLNTNGGFLRLSIDVAYAVGAHSVLRPPSARQSVCHMPPRQFAPPDGPPDPGAGPSQTDPCPASSCLANPKIQAVDSLPAGTSAPNTVITARAVHALGLQLVPDGWLIQTPKPLTAAQITAARQMAVASGATIETKSGQLGLSQISDGATALGVLIALGVLAMTIGLIRSETASDLRTLTAAGAGSRTRRTITGATAGALGLLGALLGTAAAALAGIARARSSLGTTFGNVPAVDILAVLVGLPLVAAIGGLLFAGWEPQTITRQPLE